MDEMFKVMVPMSTSETNPYIARNISKASVCRTPVEVHAVIVVYHPKAAPTWSAALSWDYQYSHSAGRGCTVKTVLPYSRN